MVGDQQGGAIHAAGLVDQEVAALRVGVVGDAEARRQGASLVQHLDHLRSLGARGGARVQHLPEHECMNECMNE